MSFTFYEAEEIARLNREETMRAAEQARIARRMRPTKEKRVVVTPNVWAILGELLMALTIRDADAAANSAPNASRQTSNTAAPNPIH